MSPALPGGPEHAAQTGSGAATSENSKAGSSVAVLAAQRGRSVFLIWVLPIPLVHRERAARDGSVNGRLPSRPEGHVFWWGCERVCRAAWFNRAPWRCHPRAALWFTTPDGDIYDIRKLEPREVTDPRSGEVTTIWGGFATARDRSYLASGASPGTGCRLFFHFRPLLMHYILTSSNPGQSASNGDKLGTEEIRMVQSRLVLCILTHGRKILSYLNASRLPVVKEERDLGLSMRSVCVRKRLHELQRAASCPPNPILRGWIAYFGRFQPSALAPIYRYIDMSLVAWAKRKYKRFRESKTRAGLFIIEVFQKCPRLFAHWKLGMAGAFA